MRCTACPSFTDESYFGPGFYVNRHNEVFWKRPRVEASREMESLREYVLQEGGEEHVFVVLRSRIGAAGPRSIDLIDDEGGRSNILTSRKYIKVLEE